ncbi:histidine phosphatase family protein [Microbulbifer sp. 2205BS26-8]|uniref:histidine phosphatase family protein n=1 Tax=Microbulbifer sp. 2205BS26-8 TaxID=3064386 RepID=UPI00273D240B|nr:histidine phosphatase family protein [Microbulbifer sp. 2205BS26-8]MDP5208339.1 histidine phosphatase family protein [Microbulbifer sp. 2205BS26-8]
MAECIVVRHGQASFGSEDYDKLSENGWQQSRWLGDYWRQTGLQFDRILCGSLHRHRQTTEGICEGLQVVGRGSYEIVSQLDEFDFLDVVRLYEAHNPSCAPGPNASRADFFRFLKQGMLAWAAGEITPAESWCSFERRIREVLGLICDSAKGSRTLVVSSGGTIAMMIRQILGSPPESVANLNMQIQNTATSRFFFSAQGISLHSFNHVPHLDRDGRRKLITYS